jgi:hypothetical protein
MDLAENFLVKEKIPAGYLVSSLDSSAVATVEKSSLNNPALLGIVSTKPATTMGELIEGNVAPIALTGRVPAIVTTRNGNILMNDHLSVSSLVGVGAKQLHPGTSIGTALESTSNWNNYTCKTASTLDSITWPEDDGTNPEKPCFKLLDGTYVGKIMVFVNNTPYDPYAFGINDIGSLTLGGNPLTGYTVSSPLGIVRRISAYSDLVVARLQVGLLEVKKISIRKMDIIAKLQELSKIEISQQNQINALTKQIEKIK